VKVTLVSIVFPHPERGVWPGIERHVGELSRALAREGVEVRVITSFWNGGEERESWEGVQIYRVPDARQRWGRAAHLLNWNVRSFSRSVLKHLELLRDSDAIHTFVGLSTHAELSALGVTLFASFPHRETPDRLQDTLTQAGRQRTERQFFQVSRAVFAGSHEARRELLTAYGLAPGLVHVIPLGVDGERFRPPETPRPRDPGKERPEGMRLLYVGPLLGRKGVATLIEALPMMPESSIPVRLLIVGRGPEESSLKALADRLGVANRITFAGYVEEGDLVKKYQESDLFVFPSTREGFGLVLVEAMACGLPIITTDLPPMPEVVGDAALLVPPSDPEKLARAVVRIAGDEALRTRLSQEGRRQVEERYLWRRVALQTLEHYRKGRDAGSGAA
jgi:glycosyltransferase involved in cell wall biosynthesis